MICARVRGGAAAGSTVFCMVSSFRFGGGWDLGPPGALTPRRGRYRYGLGQVRRAGRREQARGVRAVVAVFVAGPANAGVLRGGN
jgi:hypothetical protein